MFERFLAEGIAVAGVDVGESYGSPQGRAHFTALYRELVERRGFSRKPCLLARSRGGLMLYNWAAEHPESVGMHRRHLSCLQHPQLARSRQGLRRFRSVGRATGG